MLHRARSRCFLLLFVGAAVGPAHMALAQSAAPCTTTAECAARAEQRDNAARRDEYARMVAGQESAHAAAIAAQFDARARRQGDRQAKLAAILNRRRAAYATGHN
jgi:type II secretory pathway component HofQ